jgi:hypothetical protein
VVTGFWLTQQYFSTTLSEFPDIYLLQCHRWFDHHSCTPLQWTSSRGRSEGRGRHCSVWPVWVGGASS